MNEFRLRNIEKYYGKEVCLDIDAGDKRFFQKHEVLFLKLNGESCHIYKEM